MHVEKASKIGSSYSNTIYFIDIFWQTITPLLVEKWLVKIAIYNR